jgi:hypothetical protein
MLVLDAYRWGPQGPVRVAQPGFADALARGSQQSLHRLGAAGLALGASIGAWVEWLVLRRAVARRAGIALPATGWRLPAVASLAILPGLPVGRWLVAVAGPGLAGRPSALTALIALAPAAAFFAVAAVALRLDDLPGVRRLRGVVR